MLGFYNSIERKFEPSEVLRFLVQTQLEKTKDRPYGLNDTLSIVLLDEMNLANVELYFAEFLSLLEQRSSKKPGEEPSINIKLGLGQSDYYPLKLGRNVLWVSTMNQDETTKPLSDKVLDRGIVINFPRPENLAHEKKQPLSDSARPPLLPSGTWGSWKKDDTSFVSDWVDKCRGSIEEVNKHMSKVGLAVGHRVWQGIEQYMINHPRVLCAFAKIEKAKNDEEGKLAAELKSALKDAFEDQLAQKVMPKLRGIETSGEQKRTCLEPINELIKDDYKDLAEDFANAMKFGNGQFLWNSSNYLNKDY
jgi:5-methylcytosine-specific restriction endonuclease McrBC GTP-binding regulatory subunit McrB